MNTSLKSFLLSLVIHTIPVVIYLYFFYQNTNIKKTSTISTNINKIHISLNHLKKKIL